MRYPRTISASQMRIINQSAVLELLRRESPISRSDIGRKLDISLPTVMRIIDDLISRDLVTELDETEWSGGRRKQLLQFNQKDNLVIGLDLGGMSLYGALADIGGNILAEKKHSLLDVADSESKSIGILIQTIHEFLDLAKQQGKNVLGIGIGAPGITRREDGVVAWAPSMNWRELPLKQRIQEEFPELTILVDNDANLAALGEQWFGAGNNHQNIFFLSLGGGTGGAIIWDGMLYRGAHAAAGEIGSFLPGTDFIGFKKERYGALETVASGYGMLKLARSALADRLAPEELNALDLDDIYQAYTAGETWAEKIVNPMIDSLAVAITGASAILDPEIVILYGQVFDAFNQNNMLISALEKKIKGLPPYTPQIVPSQLGKTAVIMGTITDVLYLTNKFSTVKELL
jgi:predicted NBD/HSP70 family sugar kinase